MNRSFLRKAASIWTLFALMMLIVLGSSGAVCRNGEYRQETGDETGNIGILLVEGYNTCSISYDGEDTDLSGAAVYDEDWELCVPGFTFSRRVHEVRMTSSSGTVVEVRCGDDTDCIGEFSGCSCPSPLYGDSEEGFYVDSNGRCSSSLYTFRDDRACNDVFTISVRTTAGSEASRTFVSYFEYDSVDWGL